MQRQKAISSNRNPCGAKNTQMTEVASVVLDYGTNSASFRRVALEENVELCDYEHSSKIVFNRCGPSERLNSGSWDKLADTSTTQRRFTNVAIAIVAAALIVSASLIVAPSLGSTATSTETLTFPASSTTSVLTSISIQTITRTISLTIATSSANTSTVYIMPPIPPCDTFVWNASSSHSDIPVLLMQPNSTGYVCVVYQTAWDGNQSLFNEYSGSFGIQNPIHELPLLVGGQCSKVNGGTTCGSAISSSFKDSVTPNYVTILGSTAFFTTVFVMTALSNSTGIYARSAPGPGCSGSDSLAVGFQAQDVNASALGLSSSTPCLAAPASPFVPVSEYVTGMNVTYINNPN